MHRLDNKQEVLSKFIAEFNQFSDEQPDMREDEQTKEELHQVISWLTGFDDKQLEKHIDDKVTFEEFFQRATLNPNAHLIKGVICGYRIEDIENPLTQQARYLDKLVDELAKGKKMGTGAQGSFTWILFGNRSSTL